MLSSEDKNLNQNVTITMVTVQIMADEQKKLHPDCWKRKRSLSSASATATSQAGAGGLQHPLPHTPTHRLQHPFSFLTAAGGADHRYIQLVHTLDVR